MSNVLASPRIKYPERDGKPMAETAVHVHEITDLLKMLTGRYREDKNVQVGANMLCYYEEGNPAASFAPDVFVVFGVPKRRRRVYKIWAENRPPTVIFEVSSRETRLEDLGNKKYLYASLGVAEYFLYDPLKEYLAVPLQGFRLVEGDYQALEPDGEGALLSQRLGLRMKLEAEGLALWDAESGERLLRPHEVEALARNESQRAEHERQRAEHERQRADSECQRAEREQELRLRAEAELEKLRQAIARKSRGPKT